MQHVRPALLGAATILACQLSSPAQACSDLPNICAAQAQHYQQMNDIAATPQRNDDGPYDDGGAAGERPRDPMAQAMADITESAKHRRRSAPSFNSE